MAITEHQRRLLHAPLTGLLATVRPDGAPQTTPMWYRFEGERLLLSTRAGSQKHRNLRHDPRVSFTVLDPDDPGRYVELRGVAELADDTDYAVRDAIVRGHGHPDGNGFDPPGTHRIAIAVRPTRFLGR